MYAEGFQFGADILPFALIKSPVAAGGQSALLGLELGEGAHATARRPGKMEPGAGADRWCLFR